LVNFNIFVLRAILGVVFAVVLMRMFHPEFHIVYVAGFAIVLVALAYLLEYWRRRKMEKKK
jgi:protein-S-isoprenylcysteine O-methyltransferase Ste14